MMTLADYKSSVIELQIALKKARNPEVRREWRRAIVHGQRRIKQIESRILVKK